MTRGCLKENLITDEMLGLQDLSIERLIEYVTNVGPDDSKEELMKSVIEELEFLKNVNTLAAQGNLRCRTQIIATLVYNKANCRDIILNAFKGNQFTKEIMKGTNFLSQGVFGEVPESLTALVLATNSKYGLSSSPNPSFSISDPSSVTGSGKRNIPPGHSTAPKKPRGGFNNSYHPWGASQASYPAQNSGVFHKPGHYKGGGGRGRGRGAGARKKFGKN